MPALLRAGPSPSSRALERLEIGGVVQVLQPEVECEGRRWLQVAGNLYGRGWCSLETANEQPILRPLPARRPTAKPHRECDQLPLLMPSVIRRSLSRHSCLMGLLTMP